MNTHQFNQNGKGAKGFTLIELLVVIAIIVLLVSILVPSLKQAKELATQAVCMSSMRSNAAAANIYATSEGDRFAPGGNYTPTSSGGGDRHGPWWHRDIMGKYMGLDHVTAYKPDPEGPVLCPSKPIESEFSYISYNGDMCSDAHEEFRIREGASGIDSLGYKRRYPYVMGPALQDVSKPTDTVAIFEDGRRETFSYVTKYKTYYPKKDYFYPAAGVSGANAPHQPDYRHHEGANYGFMDGHAAHIEDTVQAFMDNKITPLYK